MLIFFLSEEKNNSNWSPEIDKIPRLPYWVLLLTYSQGVLMYYHDIKCVLIAGWRQNKNKQIPMFCILKTVIHAFLTFEMQIEDENHVALVESTVIRDDKFDSICMITMQSFLTLLYYRESYIFYHVFNVKWRCIIS